MSKLSVEDKKEIIRLRFEENVRLIDLAKTYHVHDSVIKMLIRKYKAHGDEIFKQHHITYSAEDKFKIISRVINGESKKSMSVEYNVTNAMINRWLDRYNKEGYNGLEDDKKGRPSTMDKPNNKISKSDTDELKALKERNLELEAEVEALKKLKALVLQRNAQQQKKK